MVFLRLFFFDFEGGGAALLPVSGNSSSTRANWSLRSCARMRSRMTWTRSPARKRRPDALADDFMRVLAPGVAVAAQRVDGHEALDEEVGELDEEAVFGGVEHQRGELVADAVLHEANFLPLDQFALGFGGAALGLAGFFGDLGELGLGDGGSMEDVGFPSLGPHRSERGWGTPSCGDAWPSLGCDQGELRRLASTVRWPGTPARSSALAMRCTMRSG